MDKYDLTREQNIFLAKKTIVENIYNAIKLEGCNSTYFETEQILHGKNHGNVPLNEIQTILNLKRAWGYATGNVDHELNKEFVCEINNYVSQNESLDWGVIRYGVVGVRLIDGSTYEAPIPDEGMVSSKLNEIFKIENITERALEYYTWGIKSQLFWDGNKRTSNIVANAILISGGKGIITIPEKDIEEFNQHLSDFYKTGKSEKVKEFFYEKCIKGLDIDKELEKKHKLSRKKTVKIDNDNEL